MNIHCVFIGGIYIFDHTTPVSSSTECFIVNQHSPTGQFDRHDIFCSSDYQFSITSIVWLRPGGRFNIKVTSYQYRKSHCGDTTILRPSYLHSGISYTGKITSLYWISALGEVSVYEICFNCMPTVTRRKLIQTQTRLSLWCQVNYFKRLV